MLRKTIEVVQPLHRPVHCPHSLRLRWLGSLDRDGETPHGARAQGGGASAGRGVGTPAGLWAPTGGSSPGRRLRVLGEGCSCGLLSPAGAVGHEQWPVFRKFRKLFGFRPLWTDTKCREKPPENSCRPNSPGPTDAERPQQLLWGRAALWGHSRGQGGKMHGRAWGPPGTTSSIPRPHALTGAW